MSGSCFVIWRRGLSTSPALSGKRNFRKFVIPSRGTRIFKEKQNDSPHPRIPIHNYGVREVGYRDDNKYVIVPERIPEIIVPDLTDFKLKAYVSYRVSDVNQSEFRAKDLFNAVYAKKIVEDFKSGQLDENGDSLRPSQEELLTPQLAKTRARQTGSDLFTERSKREEEEKYMLKASV